MDDVPWPVGGLRRKAILAALALHPGEVVSADRLVDIVWGDDAPAAAPVTLQSHLSQLRRALDGRVVIRAVAPGYRLDLDAGDTDVRVAEDLIRQGRRSADPSQAMTHLRAAVGLWRGRPLAELTGLDWFEEQAQRLDRVLLDARRSLVEACLASGQHTDLITELRELVRQDPYDEPTHGQLMLALYRAGRQSDALGAYQQLRRTLDEGLGVGPSRPLRDLQAAILRQDATLDAPPGRGGLVPAQLPSAPVAFTGRAGELAHLDGLLAGAATESGGPASGPSTAVVISAVSGTAGIGKTALAVHWAHRAAGQFPDGQLYVNLRGFDPGGPALDPAEALRGFLDAFEMPVQRIPAGLTDRAALYRSLIAGKRVLVVLDNARDAEQVRPLLPGAAGCLAIVTSRNQLTGLAATEGAHLLPLDLLTDAEAGEMLTRRIGTRRVAGEPDAVRDIIARCARLPLALAIASARAATHPTFPLATLAADLGNSTSSLDSLHGGDPSSDVRAVFSWSYRTLSDGAARLFRLLGLHPGPDVTTPATASLAAVPPGQARTLLAELTQAQLLTEVTPGRYTFHDLLRAYAIEQSRAQDSDDARQAATHRLLDHYLHTAYAAALLLYPMWDPIALARPQPGVVPEALAGHDAALAWFAAEHHVLLAAVDVAVESGSDTHTWQLAWAFTTFLLRRAHWDELVAVQRAALHAAHRTGDRLGRGHALRGVAMSSFRRGDLGGAEDHLRQALSVYADLADATGQAHTHLGLAAIAIAEEQVRPGPALNHAWQALNLFRATGNRHGQAHALNSIGWCHTKLGDHQPAITYCTEALALLRLLGDRDGEAFTWDSLGHAHSDLADHEQAVICYQHAIELFRDLRDRYYEAGTLESLGDTHHAAGNLDAALKAWLPALDILDDLHHPDAEQVRGKLNVIHRNGTGAERG